MVFDKARLKVNDGPLPEFRVTKFFPWSNPIAEIQPVARSASENKSVKLVL